MKKIIYLIILLVIIFFGCRKKNRPPYTPYTPSGPNSGFYYTAYDFSSLAIDPEGDSVAIRFDWGNGDTSNWSSWVASEEIITMSWAWANPETYYVKTQAMDKNGNLSEWSLPHLINIKVPENGDSVIAIFWILGGSTTLPQRANDVWYSSNSINWTCVSRSAPWLPRAGHTSVVFDNKIWVIGGCDTNNLRNDVWYSTNGINWICATSSAEWSPRWGHTSIVFDNKIWVMGGIGATGGSEKNDVWYSSDGTNWTRATTSAEWTARTWPTSVVFDNKIFISGGSYRGGTVFADVWCTTNGSEWTCATDSAWPSRWGHESVSFNNKIWILGGAAHDIDTTGSGTHSMWGPDDDVWCSPNGIDWICETESAEWPIREYFASVIFDNKMWILGGYPDLNDVWYSSDGLNWICATPSAGWSPRSNHTSVVFKIGGPN